MKQIQKNYMVPVLCTAIILGVSGLSAKKDSHHITKNVTQDLCVNLYEGYADIEQKESQDVYQLYEITNVEECAEVFDYDKLEYKIDLENYKELYEAEFENYEEFYQAQLEEWAENYINNLLINATYIR